MADELINVAPEAVAEPARRQSFLAKLPRGVKLGVPTAIALLAVVAGITFAASRPSQLEAAVSACELDDNTDERLGDEGTTLTLDMVGEGEDDTGTLSFDEVLCVLEELEVPDRVTALMGETRSLDGRQTGDWNDVSASWAYHPDNGLDVILTVD